MITSQDRQNSPLHRKFQSGRAIFKGLESLTRSASNVQLMITSQDRQNSLLLHEIRIGCAILKSLRISYTQSRQWTSTHYVTLLKTDHFSSKSRMCALSSIVLESHRRRSSTDHLDSKKTHCSSTILHPGALSSIVLESPTRSAGTTLLMITLTAKQNTLLSQQTQFGCAILKSTRIS